MKKEFEGIKYSLIMEISMMMKSNLLLVMFDKTISKINRQLKNLFESNFFNISETE